MTDVKQSVVFLRGDTCKNLADGGAEFRSVISTYVQQHYPDGGLLFWRRIGDGWELVAE